MPYKAWVKTVSEYLKYLGNLGKLDPNTVNYGLGYKQSIVKYSTPNFASKFSICGLWLISIQVFEVINLALWSIFQFGHTHWLKSRKICQSIKICWLTKNQLKKIPSVKTIWQLSSCFRVSGALGQFGGTGLKYSTQNGLGYTENKTKSSTPHLAPKEVSRPIFIEAFPQNTSTV